MTKSLEITSSAQSSANQRDRRQLVTMMTVAIMVFYAVFAIFSVHPLTGKTILQSAYSDPLQALALAGFYVIGLAALWIVRSGNVRLAEYGPIAMVYLAGGLGFIPGGFTRPIEGIALAMFIVFAGLFKQDRGVVFATLIALVTLTIGINQRSALPVTLSDNINRFDLLSVPLGLLSISGLVYLFLRLAIISRHEAAADIQQDRLNLAQITSQIAQRISRRMPLTEVLTAAVELVTASYPAIYHAQIFLIDTDNKTARLVASSGEVGRLLLARGHSLPVGSLSVIGKVTARNEVKIAHTNADDTIHRRNEFLPDTAVEAAFPLRLGDRVIGALDLQSKINDAFGADETTIFQSLADHLAIAIDNARLFEETERRLRENQLLIDQSHEAIEQVERLNQQLTRQAWGEYLVGQGATMGLNIDLIEPEAQPDTHWTPSIKQAIQRNNVVREQENNAQVVAVPLRVRGQVIGAMEFEIEDNHLLSPEDLGLIEEVSEQLGLAAETNRLFETSQRLAQREALVNEIATRLQTSSSVDMTLTTAAQSLKQALKASKVAIRLGQPPTNGGEA